MGRLASARAMLRPTPKHAITDSVNQMRTLTTTNTLVLPWVQVVYASLHCSGDTRILRRPVVVGAHFSDWISSLPDAGTMAGICGVYATGPGGLTERPNVTVLKTVVQ
jgi:hypothetical protein